MSDPEVARSGAVSGLTPDDRTAWRRELRNAAILEATADCIITADHEGRITDFNPVAERTFGHLRDAVLGQHLVDVIVPPLLRKACDDDFARHLSAECELVLARRVEMTAARADGSEIFVELAITHTTVDGRARFIVCLRDITDRKRADDELRRSAAYLAEGQRLRPTGLWVWDSLTGRGFSSAEARRLFGLATDEETHFPLAGFTHRVHPEDRHAFDAAIENARSERADFWVNFRVVHPDGAIRHLHALGRPISVPAGTPDEFIGTVVDVTERRLAEDEHERHAREAALGADVSGALARADGMRGMLQGCTEALVSHLGVAFARIWTLRRGQSVLELQASAGLHTRLDGADTRVPVGDREIGRIASEGVPRLTNDVLADPRIVNKEWARREGMVAFAGYPLVVEDRVVGVMAMFATRPLAPETLETLGSIATSIAQGIERKRSEEELRRSEAYLAEGQRLSHTGSWAWQLDTGDRFWSREMFRIYGFEPADVPPPFEAVIGRAHPRDASLVRRMLREAFRAGTELRFLTRIYVPGEPVKWVETYGHPVRDDDGRVVEFSGTVIDVTERVRADRRLRRAIKARYEAVLAERTRIARDMHDGLLQDVTGIALQLRALLPHVRTAPDTAAETLARTLEQTERTSREARRAVAGMRASGDSGDLVRAVENASQRVAARAGLALSVRVKGQERPVPADVREAVVWIVQESVTNVLKHAGARAVTLSVVFGSRRLRVSVTDDGRGFATLQDRGAGAGRRFGLVGMRERAANVAAALSVRSEPGRGSAVRLDVPYRR